MPALRHIAPKPTGGSTTNLPPNKVKGVTKHSVLYGKRVPPAVRAQLDVLHRYAPDQFDTTRAMQIGTGTEGAVFKVVHQATKSIVAVKVYRERFFRGGANEARILQLLKDTNTPNVVGLVDSVIDEGARQAFVITEYYPKRDLWVWTREHRELVKSTNGPAQVMSFARDLVRAVVFLQTQHGIVHTDIKPENVLVKLSSASIWCLHLADFGSMWCVTRHPAYDGVVHSEWIPGRHIPRLSDKWTTGTLTYLPPETVETGYRGPGNDVWAFALTIIWVVCGTHQFARYDSDAMNQYAIVYEAVVLPQDLYWRYPVAFLDMLLGCLDKCVLTRLTVFDLLDHPFCQDMQRPAPAQEVTVPSVTATAPQSRPCFIAPVPFIGTDICQQVQQADYAFDHWLAFSPSDYTASPASAHLRRSSHSPNQRRLFKDHELADSP